MSSPSKEVLNTPEGADVSKKLDFDSAMESNEVKEKDALLSPKPEKSEFMAQVIRLLQDVVEDNDDAIEFGVSEFMRHFRITNRLGLSLLKESDLPDGPEGTIWTNPVFKKAFSTIMGACITCPIDKDTAFFKLLAVNDVTGASSPTSVRIGSDVKESPFSLKAIQNITLTAYSGESDKYV